jgi:Zn-finger nucleic acid-binding protein
MPETIACPRCDADNPADARFCISCGASLAPATTGATVQLTPQQPRPGVSAPQRGGDKAMYCPICREVALVMADRQGIEVDYCPQCRGVWLDRGELDKIIERVALQAGPAQNIAPQRDRGSSEHREHRDYDDDYRRKKKRRGLLDELFDFD